MPEEKVSRKQGHSALRAKDGKLEKFDPHPYTQPSDSMRNHERLYATTPAADAGPRQPDKLESEEFYDLMQQYRHTPATQQYRVIKAFEAVKEFVRHEPAAPQEAVTMNALSGELEPTNLAVEAQLAEKEREIARCHIMTRESDELFKQEMRFRRAAEEQLQEAQATNRELNRRNQTLEKSLNAESGRKSWYGYYSAALQLFTWRANECDELRERLRQREAELEQRWIAVESELPKNRGQYLVWVRGIGDNEEMVRCSIEAQFDLTSWRMRGGWLSHEVQGWQPLPAPPKEGSDAKI